MSAWALSEPAEDEIVFSQPQRLDEVVVRRLHPLPAVEDLDVGLALRLAVLQEELRQQPVAEEVHQSPKLSLGYNALENGVTSANTIRTRLVTNLTYILGFTVKN